MRDRELPRDMPFFKLFSKPWLEGSIRFDCTIAERGVFVDLLAMANESRNRGVIQANPTTPYPHEWLASKLHIPLDIFEECLKKFTLQERLQENSNGITIFNFHWYQDIIYPRKRGRPRKRPPAQEQVPLEEFDSVTPTTEQKAQAEQIWSHVLGLLQLQVSKANYTTWLEKTEGLLLSNDILYIAVPTSFVSEYLEKNQKSVIQKETIRVIGHEVMVKYIIGRHDQGQEG